jgi:hypothetical protein
MLIMSKHYPVEQRERAVKMVLDHLDEYRSVYAACQAIGPKVGVGAEFAAPLGVAGPGGCRPAAGCHDC